MFAVSVDCFNVNPCIFAADCYQRSGSGLGRGVKGIPSDDFGRRMLVV